MTFWHLWKKFKCLIQLCMYRVMNQRWVFFQLKYPFQTLSSAVLYVFYCIHIGSMNCWMVSSSILNPFTKLEMIMIQAIKICIILNYQNKWYSVTLTRAVHRRSVLIQYHTKVSTTKFTFFLGIWLRFIISWLYFA